MAPTSEIVSILFRYYKLEQLSDKETAVLEQWLSESTKNQLLFDELSNASAFDKNLADFSEINSDPVWKIIESKINQPVIKISSNRVWLKYAAIFIGVTLVISVSLIISSSTSNNPEKKVAKNDLGVTREILPGKDLVSLTLSNGRKILLDGQNNKAITDGGNQIAISDKELLKYSSDDSFDSLTNKLETPVGKIFQVVLSDGTKVWLNALSTLTYPVKFSTAERRVTLEGEAYFDVVHKSAPFIITGKNAEVKVLGTRFDINNYGNEQGMLTTLFEGIVQLKTDRTAISLVAGESAKSESLGYIEKVVNDTAIAIAWKNQVFHFHNAGYDEIFRQLARWYNIDVEFERSITERFTGILPKDRPLTDLLNILGKAGDIKFDLVGNQVRIK